MATSPALAGPHASLPEPHMAQLFVDPSLVARARDLAGRIADQVQGRIDLNTTVSIERTVLRLYGVAGTGSTGAPIANLVVERLQQAGVLGRGAAYWLGRALRGGET